MRLRNLAATVAAAAAGAMAAGAAFAQDASDALPKDGGLGLIPGFSPLKHDAIFFHDVILLPIITIISLFVLGLLIWVVVRYNKRANPTPAKWSHNTTVEVIWTAVPVLILMVIAVFSFRLLFAYHDMPKPDLTVKATGYQWYWGYEYPDQQIAEITSVMLPEADAKAQGVPYRLAADNSMVVPVGKTVRVLVTAADVIHALALPAFGLKVDAIPGRVNETWFRAEKEGVFYGQCSELCGVDHAFMPIQIEVVSQEAFDAWVAERAPPPAPVEAAAPAAAPEAPAAAPASEATASVSSPAAPVRMAALN